MKPHGDAPLLTQLLILVGAGFVGLVIWALPDLRAWSRGEPPVLTRDSCRAAVELAEHYAGIITGCLNRGVITEDGAPVIHCRMPKK